HRLLYAHYLGTNLVGNALLHPAGPDVAVRHGYDHERGRPLPDDRPERRGAVGGPADQPLLGNPPGAAPPPYGTRATAAGAAGIGELGSTPPASPHMHHLRRFRAVETARTGLVERHGGLGDHGQL